MLYLSTSVAATLKLLILARILGSSTMVWAGRLRQTPVAVAVATHWWLAKLITIAVDVEKVDKPGGTLVGNIGNWNCRSFGYVMNVSSLAWWENNASQVRIIKTRRSLKNLQGNIFVNCWKASNFSLDKVVRFCFHFIAEMEADWSTCRTILRFDSEVASKS